MSFTTTRSLCGRMGWKLVEKCQQIHYVRSPRGGGREGRAGVRPPLMFRPPQGNEHCPCICIALIAALITKLVLFKHKYMHGMNAWSLSVCARRLLSRLSIRSMDQSLYQGSHIGPGPLPRLARKVTRLDW
jgi:hypothetical protein